MILGVKACLHFKQYDRMDDHYRGSRGSDGEKFYKDVDSAEKSVLRIRQSLNEQATEDHYARVWAELYELQETGNVNNPGEAEFKLVKEV